MDKKIFCVFLKRKEKKLKFQPYPGELGKKIFNEVSEKAWKQWLRKQTVLINEKQFNSKNSNNREFLKNKMIKFLFKKNFQITKIIN